MGATADGKLSAIAHEGWSGNLKDGKVEVAAQPSQLLYAGKTAGDHAPGAAGPARRQFHARTG
jgi:hypothetical protein